MEIGDCKALGKLIRSVRKGSRITQRDLAFAAGTGLRFIIELEQGKVTCQLGKVFDVANVLGIRLSFAPPPTTI